MKVKSWIFCAIGAVVFTMPGVARAADSNTSNATTSSQSSTSKPTPEQTLADLKKNAANMKATEQSTGNKLLGGAAIGASGIGGMQLMQGLAEKSADTAGAAEMKAYQSTFRCGIGDNGDWTILSDGNPHAVPAYSATTAALRSEYDAKANSLKQMKTQLGIAPGIESQAIVDTSSLYQPTPLMAAPPTTRYDTAEQRIAGDKQQIAIGAAALGAGVIGGAVGNLLINKNAPKENSANILAEAQKLTGGSGTNLADTATDLKGKAEDLKKQAEAAGILPTNKNDKDCLSNACTNLGGTEYAYGDGDMGVPGHPLCYMDKLSQKEFDAACKNFASDANSKCGGSFTSQGEFQFKETSYPSNKTTIRNKCSLWPTDGGASTAALGGTVAGGASVAAVTEAVADGASPRGGNQTLYTGDCARVTNSTETPAAGCAAITLDYANNTYFGNPDMVKLNGKIDCAGAPWIVDANTRAFCCTYRDPKNSDYGKSFWQKLGCDRTASKSVAVQTGAITVTPLTAANRDTQAQREACFKHPTDADNAQIAKFKTACATANGQYEMFMEKAGSERILIEHRCFVSKNDKDYCDKAPAMAGFKDSRIGQETNGLARSGCMLTTPWRTADGVAVTPANYDALSAACVATPTGDKTVVAAPADAGNLDQECDKYAQATVEAKVAKNTMERLTDKNVPQVQVGDTEQADLKKACLVRYKDVSQVRQMNADLAEQSEVARNAIARLTSLPNQASVPQANSQTSAYAAKGSEQSVITQLITKTDSRFTNINCGRFTLPSAGQPTTSASCKAFVPGESRSTCNISITRSDANGSTITLNGCRPDDLSDEISNLASRLSDMKDAGLAMGQRAAGIAGNSEAYKAANSALANVLVKYGLPTKFADWDALELDDVARNFLTGGTASSIDVIAGINTAIDNVKNAVNDEQGKTTATRQTVPLSSPPPTAKSTVAATGTTMAQAREFYATNCKKPSTYCNQLKKLLNIQDEA